MSALKDIIREEYERLVALAGTYESELSRLPRGSITAKKIKNRDYYYLVYRAGRKVKFDYVGKEDSPKLTDLREKIERRKVVEEKLKQIRASINELSRTLHG